MKPSHKIDNIITPVKKYSIVFADDHILIRQAISNYINLLKDFVVVEQCKDGVEVMQFLQHNSMPEILITDLDMPSMNGYKLIELVKTNFPEIKILVLTVFNSDAARQMAMFYGADGFASKDIEVHEMEAILYSLFAVGNNDKKQRPLLSNKEIEFLQLICSDLKFIEIYPKLHISLSVAEKMKEDLFIRFQVKSRTGLALWALENGIVLPGSLPHNK